MAYSDIEWCDLVWNVTRGCSRKSPGCGVAARDGKKGGGCYAERQAIRHAGPGGSYEGLVRSTKFGPRWTGEMRLVEDKLEEPLGWTKPYRVFVNSMSDLFHENLSDEQILRVFDVMRRVQEAQNPDWPFSGVRVRHPGDHLFMILTKREDRMQDFARRLRFAPARGLYLCPSDWYNHDGGESYMPRLRRVMLGVSVENREWAEIRMRALVNTPAALRMVSAEPLLEEIDLSPWMPAGRANWQCGHCSELFLDYAKVCPTCGAEGYFTGSHMANKVSPNGLDFPNGQAIDLVICGAESGPGARGWNDDWARSLRDQCEVAGVDFFYKQGQDERGKKVSLPVLDGRTWTEMPEACA